MTDHYHIVVETPDANLSRGMRQLNGVYTQQFNRRHQLVGHLFQGRFKGILVERDAHLLELTRYVVLNPVRAGMVADAGDWRWSSYPAMVGSAPAPPWLEADGLLHQFGRTLQAARAQAAAGCRGQVLHCHKTRLNAWPDPSASTSSADCAVSRGDRHEEIYRDDAGRSAHLSFRFEGRGQELKNVPFFERHGTSIV
jgi:hypothetical protein